MIVGHRIFKTYQKKIKELETFQNTKQEIVYKINDTKEEEDRLHKENMDKEKQREMFKEELIDRVKAYLLDLPIGTYRLNYKDIIITRSKYKIIEIQVVANTYRDVFDKILDRNKKYVKIFKIIGKGRLGLDLSDKIELWEINDILRFHNNLEKIMLLIGAKHGYEPKPKSKEEMGNIFQEEELERPVSLIP